MSEDPIFRLAVQRIIADSADIEAQLSLGRGTRPILTVLTKARLEAADALACLVDVDAEIPTEIRRLQNEVRRFGDLVGWFKTIIEQGHLADQVITQQEREELLEILSRDLEGQEEAVSEGLVYNGATNDA
jgi:hypothetical protein